MFSTKRNNGNNGEVARIEGEITALKTRRQWLDEQLVNARRDASAAMDERRRLLTQGDVSDDASKTVDQRILAAQASEAGLTDAIQHVDLGIADAEQKLAAERDRILRQAEAAKRAKEVSEIETASAEFDAAAKRLHAALGNVTAAMPLAEHIRTVLSRMTGDVAAAVADALRQVEGYAANCIVPNGPMLPQPVVVPIPKVKPIERTNVLLLVPGRWTEPSGEVKTAGPLLTVALPVLIAKLALMYGHAVEPGSAKAKQALSLGSPEYGHYAPDRDDVFDLEKPPPKPEPRSSGIVHSGIEGADPRERVGMVR